MSRSEPSRPRRSPGGAPSRPEPAWVDWDDERLLDVRLCDLGVTIRGSRLEERIGQLHTELEAQGIRFRPHFWLSTEWFCPDGIGGVAIPFYLAHPRLERLERTLLLEVEGQDHDEFMRLLRHETGHAIDNAYGLRRRRRRQRVFGAVSQAYLDDYLPHPYSRRYVRYLPGWYAQSHPAEDFAETFAVWLDPGSDWERRYARWPAIAKLRYMDELMTDLASRPVPRVDRGRIEPVDRLRQTLREHYAERRDRYGAGEDVAYEQDLRHVFSDSPEYRTNPSAASFVRDLRRQARARVSRWTGVYQYTIDQILAEIIARCGKLDLHLRMPPEEAAIEFTVALAVQTMRYVHDERDRYLR